MQKKEKILKFFFSSPQSFSQVVFFSLLLSGCLEKANGCRPQHFFVFGANRQPPKRVSAMAPGHNI